MTDKFEPTQEHPAAILLNFAHKVRRIEDARALEFMLVNETFGLAKYRIAVLWVAGQGVLAQSGVSHVEINSPFVTWLARICESLSKHESSVQIEPDMLSAEDVFEWEQYLPASAYWFPFETNDGLSAGLLLARDESLTELDISVLTEWVDIWSFAWRKLKTPSLEGKLIHSFGRIGKYIPGLKQVSSCIEDIWRGLKFVVLNFLFKPGQWPGLMWQVFKSVGAVLLWPFKNGIKATFQSLWNGIKFIWNHKKIRYSVIAILVICFPVRITILAPAELVPLNPAVIRVPIDGVVDEIFVTPNQTVKEGQPLFKLDLTTLTGRLQVAQQEMQIASTEYRQSSLQSLTDSKSRSLLNPQEGKAVEKQLEADYLKKLLVKAQVVAPRGGIALFDDPSAWIGKPVSAGEKVMVVANEGQVEIEVWIPLNEAIDFKPHTPVTMYLNTSPLNPIAGTVKYIGHEAILRPDGSYAYRMRAQIDQGEKLARIGLRGTAKISGQYVPFSYWVLRKPLAALRQFTGI